MNLSNFYRLFFLKRFFYLFMISSAFSSEQADLFAETTQAGHNTNTVVAQSPGTPNILGLTGITAAIWTDKILPFLPKDVFNAKKVCSFLNKTIKLENLLYLDLSRTGVKNAGLVHLNSANRLKWLDLRFTGITDLASVNLPSGVEVKLDVNKGGLEEALARIWCDAHIDRGGAEGRS
ncbi:MAG: hypothetical protein K0R76_308 [Alphaproteobacteria bacterium]|jgi:hypothetical protein|nr:hypothetical protein [Alphaproteobacteria bacterium]